MHSWLSFEALRLINQTRRKNGDAGQTAGNLLDDSPKKAAKQRKTNPPPHVQATPPSPPYFCRILVSLPSTHADHGQPWPTMTPKPSFNAMHGHADFVA